MFIGPLGVTKLAARILPVVVASAPVFEVFQIWSMKLYVYVMGRAHTGSTILDILLGNSAEVESVGQLVSHIGRLDTNCSCGATIEKCHFWRGVRAEALAGADYDWAELSRAHTEQAHIKSLLPTFLRGAANGTMLRLRDMTSRVDNAIRAASGKRVVLDSSKEPTRGLFLLKYYDTARVIYLVRDPRSVVTSYYWRMKAGKPFHFLRREYKNKLLGPLYLAIAAGSWIGGHLIFEAIARVAPDRVIRVRYEDLCAQPDVELARIGNQLGIAVDEVISKIESRDGFDVGHNIGGNMIREGSSEVRFEPKKDLTRKPLPKWVEVMTLVFCWPLMGRYGYPVFEHPGRTDPAPST